MRTLQDRARQPEDVFLTVFGPPGTGKSKVLNALLYLELGSKADDKGFPSLSCYEYRVVTSLQYIQYWDQPGFGINVVSATTLVQEEETKYSEPEAQKLYSKERQRFQEELANYSRNLSKGFAVRVQGPFEQLLDDCMRENALAMLC